MSLICQRWCLQSRSADLFRSRVPRVRISTSQPNQSTFEGTLFTACPITNLVAINTAPAPNPGDAKQAQNGDYHVIPISRIQHFQLLALAPPSNSSSSSFTDAQPTIQALDTRALKARESKAIGEALDREARRGKGVTTQAQDLFDAFSRTMPARWNGHSIIVADAVTIAAPYRVDDCRSIAEGDTAALNRVRKVVGYLIYSVINRKTNRVNTVEYSSRWSARRSSFAMPALPSARLAPSLATPVCLATSAKVANVLNHGNTRDAVL